MRLAEPAGDASGLALPLRLMLVQLLLRPLGPPGVRPLLVAVAAAGLVSPRVLEAPLTWMALTGLLAARLVAEWPMSDNHAYLEAYFCLSIAIALLLPRGARALARTSRLLLGLAFAFAVLWKAGLSTDYRDGRFFRVTVLTDQRFEGTVRLVGGLGDAEIRENRQYLDSLPEGDEGRLHDPAGLRALAFVATWGGLALEALVALAFLWPGEPLRGVRHASLLAFAVCAYALAPVAGFGWLLLTMGLSDTRPQERRLRMAYLLGFLAVLFFTEAPWAAFS